MGKIKVDIVIPSLASTAYGPLLAECAASLESTTLGSHQFIRPSGFGVIPLYEEGWRQGVDPVVAFLHDDVMIHEKGWDTRILRQFENPQVGLVGFGGALRHGDHNLYKIPYHLLQLGRSYYLSNTDDAESHGQRFEGENDAAVLDGFCLVAKRELLEKMGGWQPEKWMPHHCYDYRISCEARRHGYQIRIVGVRCHHYGGLSATSPEYQDWCLNTYGKSDSAMHEAGHRMIYQEYRDVLPYWVV